MLERVKEDLDRALALSYLDKPMAFRELLERHVGVIHIIEWDEHAWGMFIELAIVCEVSPETIQRELRIPANLVVSWTRKSQVPVEGERRRVIGFIAETLLGPADADPVQA